jgi:hypothetical protein
VEVAGEDGRVTLVGVEADTVRPTLPVKPLTAVTVIVEVPEAPARICAGETPPATIVKSTKWNMIGPVLWLRVPALPVTVTV